MKIPIQQTVLDFRIPLASRIWLRRARMIILPKTQPASPCAHAKSRGACAMRLFVWDGVLVLLMYFLMYLFSSVTHCILQLGH